MFVELAILVFTLALIYHFFFEFRGHNLPPGPRPWPVIGNLMLFEKELHLGLTKLGEKYGKIYRLFSGHKMTVVLSGDMIKEALVRYPKQFADRPPDMGFCEDSDHPHLHPALSVMPYGYKWKLFRKLNHSAIKVYSENKLQQVISEEVDELCKRLESQREKPIDVSLEFRFSVTNVIMTQVYGERHEIDNPLFLKAIDRSERFSRVVLAAPIGISSLFLKDNRGEIIDRILKESYDELAERLLQHKQQFDGEIAHNFIDVLLLEKEKAEKDDSKNKQYLTDSNLITGGLYTLLGAGSDTVSTTLAWSVVYLLHNPEILERLHREIVDIIGPDEFPSLSTKKNLPILEAFTTETLRMSSVFPLAVPHMTTEDVMLDGYNIPKGTRVITNTWSLHHDPEIWKNPFTFSVDRYLDESGKFVPPVSDTFLPFGAGPRTCVGEVLARSELFMFLCRLLQKFKFETPSGCGLPSMEGESGLTLHPKLYHARAVKRH